ncbi:hypothetical protein M758_9G174000, partial [Ceratodon purpureus]
HYQTRGEIHLPHPPSSQQITRPELAPGAQQQHLQRKYPKPTPSKPQRKEKRKPTNLATSNIRNASSHHRSLILALLVHLPKPALLAPRSLLELVRQRREEKPK